ncbi:leucyl aminopeptidase [uncultured Albimonas sp.]|uniref:leucyl aminopeptidase n=1 Tax=uncultured Albimonas sp. TaxID=1331701 RepID=UPI0030EB9B30|tara:strand:- start:10 stop:1500 length:1491 start_codon:yes stop_codon:yes gene_type:complete
MSAPIEIEFETEEEGALAAAAGTVVVLALGPEGLTPAALAADAAMGGGLTRAIAAAEWKGKPGDLIRFPAPAGLSADALLLVSLGAEPGVEDARKAGGAVSAAVTGKAAKKGVSVFAGGTGAPETAAALAFGMALRAYGFDVYKTGEDDRVERGEVRLYADAPEKVSRAARDDMAVAEGVFFARDLVNEPANVLGTEEFAARLAAMGELGLEIEILEEADLRSLGMRALLGVGEGSVQPTKVVVMHWRGGGDEAPVALVGKGVVFDTGGISLKPAGGMEEMTMDMGGAGLVAGVMRALALRGAKANVVGLVGLVENMPDGKAQRPGDIVKSMKGDTIEVINTDAEGRLLLADVLWYAQERFKPAAMMNFATLTGAMIIALGHQYAGYFANDDAFADEFGAAAKAAGEKAWRLPMDPAFDKQIKSRLADIKNTGGRPAGSITAAQFLKRFVKDEVPWIHVDIAGVALVSEATDLAPRGATGWGVRAVDALVKGRETR